MSLLAVAAVSGALVAGPPPPLEPAAAAPIVIAGQPISRGHLRHWADIARAEDGLVRPRREVAQLLISHRWIREESAEQGVIVSRAELERRLRRLRRAYERDLLRSLRTGRQSRVDVLLLIRIDLLVTRLQERAAAGARTPAEAERLQTDFARELTLKWRARTVCRRPWVARECGSIVPAR